MSLISFIILLVIAAVCGMLGQAIAGYSLGGWVISTIIGFVGAYVGVWLARQLGLPVFFSLDVGGESFPVIWSIIGSALLAAIFGLLSRRRVFRLR
jgi:uncharacterized membrane protein YeaQ/YmgE (transglycosylase-associated protein family)